MLKRLVLIVAVCILFSCASLLAQDDLAWGQSNLFSSGMFSSIHLPGFAAGEGCGEKAQSMEYFTDAAWYSLTTAFGLIFAGIFINKKALKLGVWGLSSLPLILWAYINYFVDYDRIKKLAFTYNTIAENTLANIAEAQDRYKSEQDVFFKDLEQLHSHMAGSHGIDECVKILKIEAEWNHWSAQAKHVSSPDKIIWDSHMGSSLKKG